MGVHCHRCDRSFKSYGALFQHRANSSNHYECPVCDFDGTSWDHLLDHCRDEGCREVCQGCNDGRGTHWKRDGDEYWEHIEDKHVCIQCERHFDSQSNLHQHKLSHREKIYECYCCYQTFKTYGGMIVHLERGTCSNTSEVSLNELAAKCRLWRYFIDEEYHQEMYEGDDLEQCFGDVDPYMCPKCKARMPKLSSFFQHIESDSCSQALNDPVVGQLRNYLASRF